MHNQITHFRVSKLRRTKISIQYNVIQQQQQTNRIRAQKYNGIHHIFFVCNDRNGESDPPFTHQSTHKKRDEISQTTNERNEIGSPIVDKCIWQIEIEEFHCGEDKKWKV